MHDRDERRVVGRVLASDMFHQTHELAPGLPFWRSAPRPRGRGRGRRVRFVHPVQIDVVFVRRVHGFDVKGAGTFAPIGQAGPTARPARG